VAFLQPAVRACRRTCVTSRTAAGSDRQRTRGAGRLPGRRQDDRDLPGFWLVPTKSEKPGTVDMNELSLAIRTPGPGGRRRLFPSGVERILRRRPRSIRSCTRDGRFHLVVTRRRRCGGSPRRSPTPCTSSASRPALHQRARLLHLHGALQGSLRRRRAGSGRPLPDRQAVRRHRGDARGATRSADQARRPLRSCSTACARRSSSPHAGLAPASGASRPWRGRSVGGHQGRHGATARRWCRSSWRPLEEGASEAKPSAATRHQHQPEPGHPHRAPPDRPQPDAGHELLVRPLFSVPFRTSHDLVGRAG